MGHELWIVFNWPNGIVVGNLLASIIWLAIVEKRLRVHHDKIKEHINALSKRKTTPVDVRQSPEDGPPVGQAS